MKEKYLSRRSLIRQSSILAAGAVASGFVRGASGAVDMANIECVATQGRIKQSVSRWCYGKWSLDELCQVSRKLGHQGHRPAGPQGFCYRQEARAGGVHGQQPLPGQRPGGQAVPRRLPGQAARIDRCDLRCGFPECNLLFGQPPGHSRTTWVSRTRWRPSSRSSGMPRRRRSPSCWSISTARSTTRTTCSTTRPGAWRSASGWVPNGSSSSTISITHRSWKATSFALSRTSPTYFGHYHTGGNPGPQRDRRDPGNLLSGHHEGDRRDGIPRLRGPRVRAQGRSAGGADLRDPHL